MSEEKFARDSLLNRLRAILWGAGQAPREIFCVPWKMRPDPEDF
jgi:hypothetical protein